MEIRGSTYCWGQSVLVMSQVVTAPRLSVNIQRILWGRTLYFLLFGRVSTSSVLTPSHLQIGLFFRYVWRIQETNWTLLAPCYLSNSVTQRSYVLFTTRSSNTWEMPLPNHGLTPSTDSKSGASEPWGDRMNAEDEDLLVSIFMTLNPILEACLEWVLNWFATGCAVNAYRVHSAVWMY